MTRHVDFFGLPVSKGTYCDPAEGKTVQQDADSADINKILKRAGISDPRQVPVQPGVYLDVSEMEDYRGYSERLARVREFFDAYNPDIRLAFNNDYLQFLDAVNDPTQVDRLRELGIVEPLVPVEGGAGAPGAAPSSSS